MPWELIGETENQSKMDIQELLAKSKGLLEMYTPGKKVTYFPPSRYFYSCHFLADLEFPYSLDEIFHEYQDSVPQFFDVERTIRHGHPRAKPCYAPDFCHAGNYRPTGMESPAFIKQFYLKWGYER